MDTFEFCSIYFSSASLYRQPTSYYVQKNCSSVAWYRNQIAPFCESRMRHSFQACLSLNPHNNNFNNVITIYNGTLLGERVAKGLREKCQFWSLVGFAKCTKIRFHHKKVSFTLSKTLLCVRKRYCLTISSHIKSYYPRYSHLTYDSIYWQRDMASISSMLHW